VKRTYSFFGGASSFSSSFGLSAYSSSDSGTYPSSSSSPAFFSFGSVADHANTEEINIKILSYSYYPSFKAIWINIYSQLPLIAYSASEWSQVFMS